MSTPMTQFEQDWIDDASYEQLLRTWRQYPLNHPLFTGETGHYYAYIMNAKEMAIGFEGWLQASENVGWD